MASGWNKNGQGARVYARVFLFWRVGWGGYGEGGRCCEALTAATVPMSVSHYGSEPSAVAVFASLRALVTPQAASHTAWRDFAAAFLAPATEAFISGLLRGTRPAAAEGGEVTKTRGHCGGGNPEVTLAVATMDGTRFSVTVPERGCVREVKREIAKVHALFLLPSGMVKS